MLLPLGSETYQGYPYIFSALPPDLSEVNSNESHYMQKKGSKTRYESVCLCSLVGQLVAISCSAAMLQDLKLRLFPAQNACLHAYDLASFLLSLCKVLVNLSQLLPAPCSPVG